MDDQSVTEQIQKRMGRTKEEIQKQIQETAIPSEEVKTRTKTVRPIAPRKKRNYRVTHVQLSKRVVDRAHITSEEADKYVTIIFQILKENLKDQDAILVEGLGIIQSNPGK